MIGGRNYTLSVAVSINFDPVVHFVAPSTRAIEPQETRMKSDFSPEYAGENKQQKQGKGEQMSDVATANFLVEEIGGHRRVNEMLYAAFRELSKRFPHREDPHNRWTERRLRSWWNQESEVVKHFQMMELFEAAEALRKARQQHDEFKQKTADLRQMAERRKAAADRSLHP